MKRLPHLIKKYLKNFIRTIFYSYTAYLFYDFINKLTGYKKERKNVYKTIGYYPNLRNPQSFNEKILWKKIHDRNPLLSVVSDKYRVREYLAKVLGKKDAENILIPLLYVTKKPEDIPFNSLLEEYVVKPNHASGMIIFAENTEGGKRYTIINRSETTILFDCDHARETIVNICKDWLSSPHGFHLFEWAYQQIKRKIVIEKLLRNANGKTPNDYKFFVFNGKYHYLLVEYNRYIDINRVWYTPEWELFKSYHGEIEKKPENLKYMVDLAEQLGKPFDCIRIDLFLVNGKIFFSEMTNYSASGRSCFHPASFDFELGSKWKLVPNYWKYNNFYPHLS